MCCHISHSLAAEPTLHVKPSTCIKEQDSVCDTTLKATYEDTKVRSICFRIKQVEFEECRQPEKTHTLELPVKTANSLRIDVIGANDNSLLTHALLNVVTFKPEATRKRRRFSWSFEE